MSREIPPLRLGAGIGIQPTWLVERALSIDERLLTDLLSCFASSSEATRQSCHESEIRGVGYPLHSGDPKILWSASRRLGVLGGDDRAVRRRIDRDRLLNESVEEFAATA